MKEGWDVVDKLIKGNEEHYSGRAKEHEKEEKARATRSGKTNALMNSLFRGRQGEGDKR